MSVIRRNNYLGQQRIDVPDMRSIDSGIAHDFDVLGGKIITGREPIVVRGLTIDTTNAIGNAPTSLSLSLASALVMHYGATEAGTMLEVSDDQVADQLYSGNSRVVGSFASSATNYIGVDFIREADDTTNDQTKFLAANTQQEVPRTVPKGVVLDYRIIITTSPFSLISNVCPVAKIVTDGSGNVLSITDCRNLFGRLGAGGDVPTPLAGFDWPDSARAENPNTYAPTGSPASSANPFSGGDKEITSLKSWMDAVMSMVWESKSGEFWYSPTTRDGVKLAMSGDSVFGNNDNFTFNNVSGLMSWTGLYMMFENSSGSYKNDIQDGSAIIGDGQCAYVDLDRSTTSPAALNVAIADLQDLQTPNIPGSRFIIAWRSGNDLLIRDRPFNMERLQDAFNQSTKKYPDLFVSSTIGEGDYTDLATAFANVPAYGGVVIIMSDLTISSSVTQPANVKVIARRGVTLTLSGTSTEYILGGDRAIIEDLRFSSTKTTGVLVRTTGFKNCLRNCRFSVAPAGTATGLQIDSDACSVHTCEFEGVIAPSTGTGIAVTGQDYFVAGDNVFLQ